jgi:hypothetical protein
VPEQPVAPGDPVPERQRLAPRGIWIEPGSPGSPSIALPPERQDPSTEVPGRPTTRPLPAPLAPTITDIPRSRFASPLWSQSEQPAEEEVDDDAISGEPRGSRQRNASGHFVDGNGGRNAYAGNDPLATAGPTGATGMTARPGRVRGPEGRFQSDPDRPVTSSTYDRVTLRESTKRSVQDNAPKDADGNYIDPNTGQIIPAGGPFHYGHKPGYEYWRTRDRAQAEGWSREKFVEYENDPSHYWIEDSYNNMSHRFEQH